MKRNLSILRKIFNRRFSTLRSSSVSSAFSSPAPPLISPSNSISSLIARNSSFRASMEFNLSNSYIHRLRSFCSESGGVNGVVIVKSEKEFIDAMNKAQDGSLPSIFYFTAAWCGPCRFIAPVIEELSKKYPDVTTYKVDIDEGGLSNTLGKLNIAAVPTLQFFKEGSKKDEIVGADVTKLKNLMEKLYK